MDRIFRPTNAQGKTLACGGKAAASSRGLGLGRRHAHDERARGGASGDVYLSVAGNHETSRGRATALIGSEFAAPPACVCPLDPAPPADWVPAEASVTPPPKEGNGGVPAPATPREPPPPSSPTEERRPEHPHNASSATPRSTLDRRAQLSAHHPNSSKPIATEISTCRAAQRRVSRASD